MTSHHSSTPYHQNFKDKGPLEHECVCIGRAVNAYGNDTSGEIIPALLQHETLTVTRGVQ